jgi:hypothetical protein
MNINMNVNMSQDGLSALAMLNVEKVMNANIINFRWVKDQKMHNSFNVLVLNILLHVSAF